MLFGKATIGKTYYLAICIGVGGQGVDVSFLEKTSFKQIYHIDDEGSNAP